MRILSASLAATLAFAGCTKPAPTPETPVKEVAVTKTIEAPIEAADPRLAPTELSADISKLPENEQQAMRYMIDAAVILDRLFLRQVWSGAEAMGAKLAADKSPDYAKFLAHKGPWDRMSHNEAFIAGAPAKPPQASFYPDDATKEEIEKWIATLSPEQKTLATGFFTVIRRAPDKSLMIVPYSKEYGADLEAAAKALDKAAELTKEPSLKKYLELRAKAFRDDDYYASDVAWMELDAAVEPTIGPYETYEDEWFSYKAAFEAYITLRDDAETAKLAKFSAHLQTLEDRLPIDAKMKNAKLGALAPIRVVNQIYASGDGARGVMTAAFNLPNDERVTKEKGSKRVMLKNVQEAKFAKVLKPIAEIALSAEDKANVSFDAFFTHILMHELMHGLGPHTITVAGEETSVRKALKDTSSAFEEAKADISGLWALQKLVDDGIMPKTYEQTIYDTFLASSFRTLRFGINEAHGKGMAMQVNYLIDEGAFVVKDGKFAVDHVKIKQAVEKLTGVIMTIQAKGDYNAAKAMLEKYAVLRPDTQKVITAMEALPVDIAAAHVTARQLVPGVR